MIPEKRRYQYIPLAQALKNARTQAKVSLAKLGKAIGLSRHAIQRYENAQQTPSRATLVALAQYYGQSDDAFTKLLDSCVPAENASVQTDEQIRAEFQESRWLSESLLIQTVSMMPFPALMRVVEYANLLATNIHVDKETPYVADAKQ